MNAINIENLRKSFGGQTNALNNISINIPKGEMFGFLGPNRSGKTTTVRILKCSIYGFINKGNILDFGTFDELVSKKNASLKLKIRGKNFSEKLGFLYEDDNLYSKSISGDKEVTPLIMVISRYGSPYT